MDGIAFITDLHLRSANTKTEPHLLEHQQDLLNKIWKIVEDGSNKYENMYVVIAGDLTDNSIKDDILFTILCMFFRELSRMAKIYFVVGNHETTYKVKHNLFWHLAYGDGLVRPSKIRSVEKIFEVVDYFDVGTTRVICNHHGTEIHIDVPDEVKNVVVASHNNLSHGDILSLYTSKGVNTQEEYVKYVDMMGYLPETDKLKYVFKGHQHMLFGCYEIKESWGETNYDFIFYDLSSLGRPKSTEFMQPNKRDIPILEIDGDSIGMVNNYIALYGIEKLNLEEVGNRKQKYDDNKQFIALRKSAHSVNNVLAELQSMYSMDLGKLGILNNAIEGQTDKDIERYKDIIINVEVK